MYFNRKNSQQKNWRMIKKGKHFLFGCALVFTLGATANVASAETIVSEVTTVDQAQDSTAVSEEADSEAATSTAVSEVASSTTATSEVASETVATSTVASSVVSELASTTSEAVTSENSESASVASSEAASSETASSTTVEAVSEVSATVSASETAIANRTAYIGYEVQYTTSTGEVVGKTANIVATDTTDAVATSTLTVAATDVPAGYELAAEQAYSLTQQISENQINILSFAVVKKSEEEEIAESQLANKTVLEQVISEAIVLSDEALRQVATTQAGNTELEAAATSTQETIDNAIIVLEDALATQEQVDSQVEAVKASTLALAEEMLKVDEDGNLTVALNTTGTEISTTRGYGTTDNVISNYEVRDGYVYWTHQFNNGYTNTNYYNYFFTIPKSVGAMEDLVVTQYNQDGTVRSTSNSWPDGEGSAGGIAPNIGPIGNGYFDKKGLDEGRANAPLYDNNNHIASAIDRTGFAGSDAILNNSQSEYYVLNSNRRTNRLTRWVVSYRTPIVDENGSLDYIAGGSSNIKADNNDVVVGTYGALYKEVPEFYNQQKVNKGQAQNQLNDMLVWRNTEMTTPYQLPIKDNGVAIDEIYYVLADTAATEKITVDNLTISNTGVVTGSASFTGEPKTIEAVIKSGDTLVQSEQAWIVVMDAQGSTIDKNEGETVSNEEILNKVTVDWGGYDKTWEYGEAGLTKEVITPTLPTSGQNNVVQVKLTNAQGQEKIVDVIVNWPVTNQAPTIDSIGTDGTQLKTTQATNKYLFVFGTTEGTTETETGATTTAPVANKDNATATIAMSDADGTIASISYDDANSPMTTLGSNLTLGTDGKLEGSFAHAAGGSYTRRVIVTDDDGATATSNSFYTYAYTDKEVDTTSIEKEEGTAVTEDEIFAKLAIATTSDAFPNTGNNVPTVPDTEYTRTVVGYRAVGSTDVKEATVDTLPTTGEYEVRVQTRNIYGQDIYNWVTVKFTDTTAPETPSVEANEDGTVTVTPSQTAGDDTKTTDITYTDETGTSQTVTVTKEDDGTWSVPADSGVTVDPTTGAVTIPADKVQDGSTVSATSTDEAGNTSNPATDTAKNNPDTTAPEVPSVVANEDGSVTVTPSTTAGDDTKTVDITYTDENGTEQTVTVTKEDDGTWSVPADSGVTVDPTTGAVTIPADKVQDGSTVSATSTDEAGNTSSPATDTAKDNPDTTAPEVPSVVANEDGTVTVTPSTTAGDDTKTVDITYTDENGTPQTVTVTKGEDGNWSVPADSGVTVDPTTGAVTIPADKVQDGSTVSATSTDEAGNT
ncbi:KxYKxGKxW signal peptide domain-containing protein, partial [Streptococcus suis]|uniref:KxYKxGKxW signal peptide domain-containing protein n=1 Tax=Streptococcus suis TaxID=1307 RepID=UPI0021179E7E|nr:KxYKxGKxW signal peptide domain-containing protein [Streptococcus suis]